jgi:tetratricopeptide (TPR) repeat protein
MADPKPKELNEIQQLLNEGKDEQALEMIRKFQLTAWSYYFKMEFNKALEIALQSKELIEKVGNDKDIAYNFFLLGHIHLLRGDFKKSLDFGLRSLKLREKMENRGEIGASLCLIGLAYWLIGNFNQAIESCQRSLSFSEIDLITKANNLNVLGNSYALKGELRKALKYSKEGIKIANEGNFHDLSVAFSFYLGLIYTLMDDYDRAVEYLKNNLEDSKLPIRNKTMYKGFSLLFLVTIFNETRDFSKAHEYLDQLQELAEQKNRKVLTNTFLVAKGAVLTLESGRTRDRAEAERLFKKVVEDDINLGGIETNLLQYLYSLYGLIRLYIEEIGMSNDLEIIKEINPLVDRLFYLADKTKSNLLATEVALFRSKLSLVQLNFNEAKVLLTQAQEIAELNNIHFLAHRISNHHDDLLEQQDRWNRLESTNAPISERIEMASFDGVLDGIRGKISDASPEFIDEQSILLLLIAEGGVLIFSYPFADEWKHDTEIFGSFLSAFTSFSDEFFSKGLDRVKFGDDTLLIKTIDSFSVGYLYKGQTYPAKQKLTKFAEELQNNSTIWQKLNKFCKTNQVAELKDLPQIESLIKEIFIVL